MNPAERHLVLMYHRVGVPLDWAEARYCIAPDAFARHMQALAGAGFRAVPIEALVSWLGGGAPLKDRDFVLTFDDGFKGVREFAHPVLERLGWPFTVFLVTGRLGGMDDWAHHESNTQARYPLLNLDDILDMQQRGGSFHSHTHSHASLPTLDGEGLTRELVESRATLQSMCGGPSSYLAYPYGHLDARVEAAARRAGYDAAFSVQPGFNRPGVNTFHIRRLDVAGTDTPAMLLRKMHLGSNDGSMTSSLRYAVGRLVARIGGRAA